MSFPAYPAYRASGVEWLGDVPAGWTVQPVWTVSTCNDEVLDEGTAPDYQIEYIEISDVDAVRGVTGKTDLVFSDAPSRARRRVRRNDVIVSTVRTYLRAIAAVADVSDRTIASTGFAVIRARNINPAYLAYLFHAEFLISKIIAHSVGVSYPAINASEITHLKVPVPSAEEQEAIATCLNRETVKTDALVAEQERLIALLKEKRQAVISHAVTKGLDPNAPMKDSGVEWLGQVPEAWIVTRLKFLACVQGGIAKGRDLFGLETIRVPYLRVANVQDGYLDLNEVAMIDIEPHELHRYSLHAGDVLMNEGGDFDKLGRGHIWRGEIESCIHQNHVFAVRPYRIEPEWLALFMGSDYARFFFMSRAKQSTNLASISSSNLQEFPVVCPPSMERKRIMEFVAREVAQVDTLVTESERAIDLLKERRAALISAAVTGKIDVRGLAPSLQEAA
jgi:type I restriction enzyme S subunit